MLQHGAMDKKHELGKAITRKLQNQIKKQISNENEHGLVLAGM